MNFLTKIVKVPMQLMMRSPFASDNWKDRDQSAEKVYISQEESTFVIYTQRRPCKSYCISSKKLNKMPQKKKPNSKKNLKNFSRNTRFQAQLSKQKSITSIKTFDYSKNVLFYLNTKLIYNIKNNISISKNGPTKYNPTSFTTFCLSGGC